MIYDKPILKTFLIKIHAWNTAMIEECLELIHLAVVSDAKLQ